jgi:hypothetical protein
MLTQALIEKAADKGGIILAAHKDPRDNYSWTVLVHITKGQEKFVTWYYNANDNAFYHGHYFDVWEASRYSQEHEAATRDYLERVARTQR